MKAAALFTILALVAAVSAAQSTVSITISSSVAPRYQGDMVTYALRSGSVVYPGTLFTVPNGTTVSDLGLSITVDNTNQNDATCNAAEIRPKPTAYSAAEWSLGVMAPVPFSLTPTTGTFDDDTTYYIHMQATDFGSGLLIESHVLVIVVGDPNGTGFVPNYPAQPYATSIAIEPKLNGQPITGPLDVAIGTPLSALGLSINVQHGVYESVGVHTTISNVGATGLEPAQFCAYGHHSLSVPGASPAGQFNQLGTHEISMVAWGHLVGLELRGGYTHWTHGCIAIKHTLTINVVPDPRISVSDSQGAVAYNAAAAGDRDFGVHDAAMLPTPWITISIANTGNGDLTLGGFSFGTPAQGSGGAAFGFDTSAFNTTVAQGGHTVLRFRLEGGSLGVSSVWIELPHDDPTTPSPFRFQLRGEVTAAPRIAVSDAAGAITPGGAAAGPRDFGMVDIATMPTAAVQVTISNPGSALLQLGTPACASPDFVLDLSGFNAAVQPGGSTSFGIVFSAATIGLKSGTVTLTHNDGTVVSPFTFGVAGIAYSTAVPLIVTTSLPGGLADAPYGPHVIQAVGGTGSLSYSVASGSLPSGLSLSAGGVVSGTPRAAGLFGFVVRVQDSVGADATQALEITIAPNAISGGGSGGGSASGGGCVAAGGTLATPLLLALCVVCRRRRRA